MPKSVREAVHARVVEQLPDIIKQLQDEMADNIDLDVSGMHIGDALRVADLAAFMAERL